MGKIGKRIANFGIGNDDFSKSIDKMSKRKTAGTSLTVG
jgi:hypothetical protein